MSASPWSWRHEVQGELDHRYDQHPLEVKDVVAQAIPNDSIKSFANHPPRTQHHPLHDGHILDALSSAGELICVQEQEGRRNDEIFPSIYIEPT